MIGISNIIGNVSTITYDEKGEINVHFEGHCIESGGRIKFNTISHINVIFQKNYNKKIKLTHNILGFALYDYPMSYDEKSDELIKISDEKHLYIDIYEDIENFDNFNKLINENSKISVAISDEIYDKNLFDVIEGQYQWQTRLLNGENISENISESFLKVTSYYYNDPEDLAEVKEKYYPILRYKLYKEFNKNNA